MISVNDERVRATQHDRSRETLAQASLAVEQITNKRPEY